MQIEILNPLHDGFYGNSILNAGEEGNGLDPDTQYNDNQDLDGYINDNDFYLEYNYEEYQNEVTKAINDYFIERATEKIEEVFGIKDLFIKKVDEELVSPREYNFGTDRAFIKMEVDERKYNLFIYLMFKRYHDEIESYIKRSYTSRPGFISFYSNRIEDWENNKELDHNELNSLFDVLLDDGEDDIDVLFELVQEVWYSIDVWYEKDGKKYGFHELQEIQESLQKESE